MQEKMRFDTHLKKTNIPETIEELVSTRDALLETASEQTNPFLSSYTNGYEAESGIWKRYDETENHHYIQLGVHALRGDRTIIAFNNHRPLDHNFPEPPVDLNSIVHSDAYDKVTISIFPLNGRVMPVLYQPAHRGIPAQPLYPSSLNEEENDQAAEKFEAALDKFHESFLLNVSLLGLIEAIYEKRSLSATLESVA